MTTAEYLQTPETVLPRELAYGVLHVADSPTVSHQRAVLELTLLLAAHVRERQLGELVIAPMDVILDFAAGLVVQPDLTFVSAERRHIVSDKVYGAPDLAIEVLSPHPRIGRLEDRVKWFAEYGVRECWLAHVERKEIVVLSLAAGGVKGRTLSRDSERVQSTVLPDLRLTPLQIFGW